MHRLLFNINTLLMVSFHALMRFRVCQWKLASLFTPSTKGAGLAPLPARLTSSPPRLADFRYSTSIFEKYTECNVVKSQIKHCEEHNRQRWLLSQLLNVVSPDGPNTFFFFFCQHSNVV
ncbi:hypothetical protein ARALYDRAFT_888979 [Arabidopsis lyrata subsp. lyrata]|uniref:Uncharacterized protein n=1 Tax=Arabidopsis lyrata subsp. lyrata TaxID=81972 RepID=D7KDK5_ARALL|nr:hypothetical protein ARALYDRAFT_888979 [Arabidopsis lyrata subsp. lyrata]